MTRTGTSSSTAWESNSIAIPEDGNRVDSSAAQDPGRPRGRIRRSMTACNTCRKLKTRCDLDPRGHACRRCLSLRLECELPETSDRFQDNASTWSDANAANPSIEERLASLERTMGEMMHMMRQMANRSPRASGSPVSQAARSNHIDESSSCDGGPISTFTLKPAQLIRDLQAECFGERDQFATDTDLLGDVVTQGIVDSKLSVKLIELFVEYFGPWVSINLASSIQQSNTLLFNTACLLGSRYLPGIPPHTIRDISVQVQHVVAKTLWKSPPLAVDTIQALMLLCLYSNSVQKEPPMDGWLLSGISINHALISFGLFNASVDNIIGDDMFTQLRLWNTLCLTHLYSAIGNGRSISIHPQYLDQCPRILKHPRATSEDGKVVAEIQLYRITLRLQRSQQRLLLAESEYEEIERWKMEWAHVFTNEEQSTLELSVWFCQMLLHRTAARLQPEIDRLVPEICGNARLIISKFMQVRFPLALGLIDHVYSIVAYAAITMCDYNISDPLIDQVRALLLHLAPSSDHISYRIACIIAQVQRRYSDAAADSASAASGGDALKDALFAAPHPPRAANMDLSQLMPTAEVMNTLVDEYGCINQLIPGYAAPHPPFSGPTVFQHHLAPVTGGAMPVSLVPRALHDW